MLQLACRPFTSLALSVRQRTNNICLNSDFSGKLRLQVFSTDMCYQSRMIHITDCNHPRSRLFCIKDRTLSNSRVLNAMPRSQQTTQIYDLSISLSLSLKLCVLVGVTFAITIAITMATATATILSNIDMPLLLQTGMCIHRSRTNGRIDALLSHSVILPFKRS